VSCPHAQSGGSGIGYEPEILEKVLKAARAATEKPVSVKLPPYMADQRKLEAVVRIAEQTGMDWITEINTLSAMDFSLEFGIPILSRGIGGQSGPSIHYIALAQVAKTRKLTKLPIVAVGGIVNSYDANRFLHPGVGANAVQLGSGLLYHKSIKSFVRKVLRCLKY
jgi:dihydroorotate dehydrogenase (NAD+) catalytic subunit